MDKLPEDLLIDITSFFTYDDICNFFIISTDLLNIFNKNKNYLVNNTLKKYNLWIIDNNNSYTIRNKTGGYTMHKSICDDKFTCLKNCKGRLFK